MIPALMLLAADPVQDSRSPLLIDRDRIDRPRTPMPVAKPRVAAAAKVAAQGSTAAITGVRFRGSRAPAPVAAAAIQFLGKTADPATLQALAGAMSDAYARSDVALYTVSIPEQDFAGGVVTVLLTEATIIRASVKTDDPAAHPRLRERMAPLLAEKPLRRRTLERQLTLMRAIPGLTIDPALTDPNGTGALDLTVTPNQRRRKVSVGFGNRGIDLLGDGQFDARAEFYGAVRDGDQISLAAASASDFKRYRYASGAYAVPVTPGGLTFGVNAAYLETRPRGTNLLGKAKLAGATLNYPLLRNFHQAADLSIGVDGIDSDNAVFGNVIATERSRAVRAAGGFSSTRERTSASVSGSLSLGLDVLGARVVAPLAETGFAKATLAGSFARAVGKRAAVRVNASGQYSRDRLPAAERFAIGGESIGRAFDTGVLTGDRGVGALVEFAVRPVRNARFGESELYSFVDGGVVGVRSRGPTLPQADYTLASAGIGGRLRLRDKAELGLEAARSLDRPYAGLDDDWRLSVAWRLSL